MSQNVTELAYAPAVRVGSRAANAALLAVFVATLLLSSFLLFLIQPMFGKMVLPLLGGTPSVWNTVMLFFQSALLGGYAYSHLIVSRLQLKRQMAVHLTLLVLPLLALPIALPAELRPPAESSPVGWLLLVMAVTVGLPFFAVSTTAPLLQRWFSHTTHPSGSDPYFLYAASNAGSLAALIGYPLVVEPALPLTGQSWMWAVGYGALVVGVGLCAATAWTRRSAAVTPRPSHVDSEVISIGRRLRWIILALVPSSLMIGVTSHLSTDIAAVPLLWVVPLTLYLVTFIVTFSKAGPRVHGLFRKVVPVLVILLVASIVFQVRRPTGVILVLHLLTFFAIAMALHGELNRDRPPPRHLTSFYLWISVGGMLGGVLNALIAPALWDSFAEYPLMLLAAYLSLMTRVSAGSGHRRRVRVLLNVGIPALALTISAIAMVYVGQMGLVKAERNFFGLIRVKEDGSLRKLVHGTTVHGAQSLDGSGALEPLTYYHRTGPAADIFEAFAADPDRSRVAAVGLGTGSIACYATPGQRWTFYEIDPGMHRVAREMFGFLDGCGGNEEVIIGDGRLMLADAPAGGYDLIVLDAFSSDAIPVHLLTAEALDLYLDKLSSEGLLAFHISNRHLDLGPVLAAVAADRDLVARQSIGTVTEAEERAGKSASRWVVMSRTDGDMEQLADDPSWVELSPTPGIRAWSDSYSNVLSVFHWN